MTNKKALELLNDMEFAEKYQGIDEYTEMLIMCKEALAKQIPMKPHDDEHKWFHFCPKCEMIFDADDEWVMLQNYENGDVRFCMYCGQKLDWSD